VLCAVLETVEEATERDTGASLVNSLNTCLSTVSGTARRTVLREEKQRRMCDDGETE